MREPQLRIRGITYDTSTQSVWLCVFQERKKWISSIISATVVLNWGVNSGRLKSSYTTSRLFIELKFMKCGKIVCHLLYIELWQGPKICSLNVRMLNKEVSASLYSCKNSQRLCLLCRYMLWYADDEQGVWRAGDQEGRQRGWAV